MEYLLRKGMIRNVNFPTKYFEYFPRLLLFD